MVASVMPDLQKFFVVPKFSDSSLQGNELVISFINFLLQILDCKTDPSIAGDDLIGTLRQELKFLVTILGDTPMLSSDLEEVNNLLKEFEAVADEAGNVVFSTFFAVDRVIASCTNAGLQTAVNSLFIVDSLLDDLKQVMDAKADIIDDLKDHIRILHEDFMFFRSFLKDIKEQNPEKVEESTEAVKQVWDLAYEAEYLISSFKAGDLPVWYLTLRLRDVVKNINLIRAGFGETKKNCDVEVFKVAEDFSATVSLQDTSSPMDDSTVVGFEKDAEEILDQLIGQSDNLQIITICGMPGLGKTTLAKKLYNDLDKHFDKCAWCVVSQTYQRRNLLTGILSSLREVDRETASSMDDAKLGERLHKTLKNRRYLVVLDDIWDPIVWDDLMRYFPDDGNGSRIMFTSQIKDVAPPDSVIHPLRLLSHDESWELLQLKAFRGKPCPHNLMDVGKRIAELCNGLPLIVVVIAGVLANKKEETEWKKVEESLGSYIFADPEDRMKKLELSYNHLPDHLKPCFLYFGVFPEDSEISTWKLISLWIAEGFIKEEEEKILETTAEEYLLDLIDRSLVIIAKRKSSNGVKACSIHDLLRELCLRKAQEENFRQLAKVKDDKWIYDKHCSSPSSYPSLSRPFGLHLDEFLGHLLDPSCLPSMKLVRVVDVSARMLNKYEEEKIPLLRDLRYLGVDRIPSSLSRFWKLEFLHISSGSVVTIPCDLLEFVRLRYVHIEAQAKFDKDCRISKTNNLHTLSLVRIYKLEDEDILRYSPNLRKLKCICQPLLVHRTAGAYRYPDLSFLGQLESLKMEFQSSFRSEYTEINFPTRIKKLNLSKIALPWEKMSVIGELPNLEVLKLVSDAFEGQRWRTRNGEFQNLRFLKLDRMKFSRWNVASSRHFPRLERLVLHKCYNLLKIPSQIGNIPTLQMIEAHSCGVYVRNSALRIKEEQEEYGNEELKVVITGDMW
ncbi:UNVERIFIED_CONTAM: putative late blight resistance proteinR1A-10 [Sesamum calycinum]|uniref:Late blight resistance proteinR1A-10 n=1 Tax=Sesamum calycinum TaxID=2727403 RepID=A0AAW2KES9_9LAMI